MNIAIVPGLYEGFLHTVFLRHELNKRGHKVTALEDADMVLAHSGGWLFIDSQKTETTYVLIDPAYHDDRSLIYKSILRFRDDLSVMTLSNLPVILFLRVCNLIYFFALLPRWIMMGKRYASRNINDFTDARSCVLVRAEKSPWHSSKIMKNISKSHTLPGDHDACWYRPRELADILDL